MREACWISSELVRIKSPVPLPTPNVPQALFRVGAASMAPLAALAAYIFRIFRHKQNTGN